jgi:hypothetical protein
MLFRLILNKANIKVVPMLSNQLSSFELVSVNNSFLMGKLPMSKKKKAADKPAPKDKPAKSQKGDEEQEDETTKTRDYGGLPDRNLKKNLGCG